MYRVHGWCEGPWRACVPRLQERENMCVCYSHMCVCYSNMCVCYSQAVEAEAKAGELEQRVKLLEKEAVPLKQDKSRYPALPALLLSTRMGYLAWFPENLCLPACGT